MLTHGSGDCYAFAPASRSQKTPQVETLFDNGIGICSRRETHRFRIQKLMCRRIAECRIRYSGRKVRLGRFYSSESAGSLVSSEPTKICTRLFCMGKQSAASVAGCRTQVNSEREAKLVTWRFRLSGWAQESSGEFDPGSERTLAACLTHASRARTLPSGD